MTTRRYDDAEDGQPIPSPGGWLGLLKTILTTAGPVALMATVLCGFLMFAVWGRLNTLDASAAQVLSEMRAAKVTMHQFAAAQETSEQQRTALLQSQIRLLRQVCVNGAKNDYQTRACLQE
jgi:hypothetical protein